MLRLLKMYIAKLMMWIEGDSWKQTSHQEIQGQAIPKMYALCVYIHTVCKQDVKE